MKNNILPDTLHETVLVAKKDLLAIKENPNYKLDMGIWHTFDKQKNKCLVCLAGAVLANTYKINLFEYVSIVSLENQPDSHKLIALDEIRGGYIPSAIRCFYGGKSRPLEYDEVLEKYPFLAKVVEEPWYISWIRRTNDEQLPEYLDQVAEYLKKHNI